MHDKEEKRWYSTNIIRGPLAMHLLVNNTQVVSPNVSKTLIKFLYQGLVTKTMPAI